MGPTWVLSAPDGPHDGPMNLAIRAAVEDAKQHPRMNDEDTHMIRFLSEGGGTDQKAGRSQMRGWIPQGGCDWKVESNPLHWRRNGYDTVSNHQPHHCLLNRSFRRRSKKKYQSSASLAFVRGVHRRPVNSPHKWPVTRKMFPFDDVIMLYVSLFDAKPVFEAMLTHCQWSINDNVQWNESKYNSFHVRNGFRYVVGKITTILYRPHSADRILLSLVSPCWAHKIGEVGLK